MLKVTRPRFRPRFPSSSFAPGLLFGSGIQGVWYDPSDFSTMFQDVAGTTPVTDVGQSVALIRDKSGNGNHATQSVLASRPTLNVDASGKYFLLFDGSNDSLFTGNVNLSSTDKVTVFSGIRKLSDSATGIVVEITTGTLNSFYLSAPQGAAATYTFRTGGSLLASANSPASYASPITNVVTGIGNISSDIAILRVNGTQVATSSADQGTGNYSNSVLYIGRRSNSTLPFNGRLYSLIVRGSASAPSEIATTESWVNGKTGAY